MSLFENVAKFSHFPGGTGVYQILFLLWLDLLLSLVFGFGFWFFFNVSATIYSSLVCQIKNIYFKKYIVYCPLSDKCVKYILPL